MPVLAKSPILRLFTLCCLYVAQGIPFGFVVGALQTHLGNEGVSAGEIGTMVGMVSLPWAFKWIWGPFVDSLGIRSMGRRRPWILFAQIMMIVTLGAMLVIPDLEKNIVLLGWCILIHNIFASLQDVSVDALAIDLLRPEERGRANGLMYGSSWLGRWFSGVFIGHLLFQWGLPVAVGAQMALLGAIMCLPLFLREREDDHFLPTRACRRKDEETARSPSPNAMTVLRELKSAFWAKAAFLCAIFAILVNTANSAIGPLQAVYFQNTLGWEKEYFLKITAGHAVICGAIGSVLGGFIADKLGTGRMVVAMTVMLGGLWIAVSFLHGHWDSQNFLTACLLVSQFFAGVLSVSMFALFMSICRPVVAATQFTAYMALLNLSITLGSNAAGWLETVPMPTVYLGIGIFQASLALIVIFAIQTKK